MRSTRLVPVLLAFAAGLHLAAMPSHLEEGVLVGGFFLAVAVAQLTSAVLVHRGVTPLVRAGIAAMNVGVIAVWAVSRTVGLSLGGHSAAAEPISLLDALAVAAQLVAVVGLYLHTTATRPVRPARLAGVPALALVALIGTGVGLPMVPAAHAHADVEAPAVHSHDAGAAHHHDH